MSQHTHPNGWTVAESRQTRWLTPKPLVEALGTTRMTTIVTGVW